MTWLRVKAWIIGAIAALTALLAVVVAAFTKGRSAAKGDVATAHAETDAANQRADAAEAAGAVYRAADAGAKQAAATGAARPAPDVAHRTDFDNTGLGQ